MSKEESFYYIRDNIPEYTMYGYMLECNKNNMNNPAIRLSSYRLTYQQFDYEISRYAKGLLAMGIKKEIVLHCYYLICQHPRLLSMP